MLLHSSKYFVSLDVLMSPVSAPCNPSLYCIWHLKKLVDVDSREQRVFLGEEVFSGEHSVCVSWLTIHHGKRLSITTGYTVVPPVRAMCGYTYWAPAVWPI